MKRPCARSSYALPAAVAATAWLVLAASAQTPAPAPRITPATAPEKAELRLEFEGAPLEIVLQNYSDVTKRTLLLGPNVPNVNITLRSQGFLSRAEYLEAIRSVLAMHGVALIAEGEKFVRVVPGNKAREEPMPILEDADREALGETSRLVSQLIKLKHIEFAEADKAIKPLLHSARGQIHHFELINSLMVTDTEANVRRMLQMIEHLDVPVPVHEEPAVVKIEFAKASEIKAKLEEVIAESQAEARKTVTVSRPAPSGSPRMTARPVPGVVRAPRPTAPPTAPPTPQTSEEIFELAERGIIRGRVHIVADDRTNVLIIITRPENMEFFRKIIDVLDKQTEPDFITQVIRLEHADAETVAATLNSLIGSSGKDAAGAPRGQDASDERVAALRDYVHQMRAAGSSETAEAVSKVGALSADNIKILSDKRINSLVVMASQGDMKAIVNIVDSMDIRLSQVLIETVIMEVQLGKNLQSGVDWVQQAMAVHRTRADGSRQVDYSFAGGGGGGSGTPREAAALTGSGSIAAGSGLTYYLTHFGVNIDAVLNLSAGDGRTRILSSPVIVTHDNTEASIDSSEERYFYKGKKWIGTTTEGRYEDDVDMRPVGLNLTVTPRINQKKFVVMEITQKIDEVAGEQQIGDTTWPTVLSREMSASVAVQNRETIILGGLVRNHQTTTRRGIPGLYRIPIIGRLFGFKRTEHSRSEIIVFLTPYVLDTEREIAQESRRRKESGDTSEINMGRWSGSELVGDGSAAVPRETAEEQYRRRRREALAADAREAERILDLEMKVLQNASAEP